MSTTVDEIAEGIYRISTYVPDIAPPAGFTFNQFLVDADQPLLFHAGHRQMFPVIAEAVGRVMPVERLRWITFGHIEADECGAMNEWLAAAPQSSVVAGELACMLTLNDTADRPPRPVADGEVLDLGGKRIRIVATPHVPHNWEAQVAFEETTGTLLCGDLFTHVGNGAAVTSADIVGPAVETEEFFHASSLAPQSGETIRRLAQLDPRTLAVMHGSSFVGDCAAALDALAGEYERLAAAAAVPLLTEPARR